MSFDSAHLSTFGSFFSLTFHHFCEHKSTQLSRIRCIYFSNVPRAGTTLVERLLHAPSANTVVIGEPDYLTALSVLIDRDELTQELADQLAVSSLLREGFEGLFVAYSTPALRSHVKQRQLIKYTL